MSVSALDVLKRFDAYPKTLDDFRIKTLSGGTITVISAIVMILLFATQIQDYLTPGRERLVYTLQKVWNLPVVKAQIYM